MDSANLEHRPRRRILRAAVGVPTRVESDAEQFSSETASSEGSYDSWVQEFDNEAKERELEREKQAAAEKIQARYRGNIARSKTARLTEHQRKVLAREYESLGDLRRHGRSATAAPVDLKHLMRSQQQRIKHEAVHVHSSDLGMGEAVGQIKLMPPPVEGESLDELEAEISTVLGASAGLGDFLWPWEIRLVPGTYFGFIKTEDMADGEELLRRLNVAGGRQVGLAYDRALHARPVLTKSCTGGGLAFLGDLNAQQLEVLWDDSAIEQERSAMSRIDVRRSAAFTSMSLIWTGPVNHTFYELLERWFPQSYGWRTVLPKVAATQLFANPFLYLPTFYLWTGLVLGRSLEETKAKARREYWETLRACWLVMGAANVFMFTLISVQYQASFMAFATFCYNIILSIIANRDRRVLHQSACTDS